jgi:hypothetical protein
MFTLNNVRRQTSGVKGYQAGPGRLLENMRHVLVEPRSGSVVKLAAGDRLVVRLSRAMPGFEWRVAAQPGWLLQLPEPHRPERPSNLPAPEGGETTHGFLAFAAPVGEQHRLRFELFHPHRGSLAAVRELALVAA